MGYSTSDKAIAAAVIAIIAIASSFVAFNFESTQPISPYSFMIYQDPVVAGQYDAKASNGTVCWTSTNAANVINNCTEISNRTVFVMNGLYPLNGYTVLLADGVSLIGQSWATILQISPNSGYTANAIQNLKMNNNLVNYNITVRNLQIDGNVYNQNITVNNHQKAIEFQNVTNGLVDHVFAHDTSYDLMGAWFGSENCVFQNNLVRDSLYKNGIFIEASQYGNTDPSYQSKDCKVVHNYIYDCHYSGIIAGDGSINTLIDGNTIINGTTYGLETSLSQGMNFGNRIVANTFQNCGLGMSLNNCSNVFVALNTVNASVGDGISVDNSVQPTIIQNSILNTAITGAASKYDLNLQTGTTYALVQSNICNSPNATGGINSQGICNQLLENIINNGTIGIQVINGNGDKIVGNTVNGTSGYACDVASSTGVLVSVNTFVNGGWGGSNKKAVGVESDCILSTFSFNTINHWGTARTGWGFNINGNNNQFFSNTIQDSATLGQVLKNIFEIYGTGNYFSGNFAYNFTGDQFKDNTLSATNPNIFRNNPTYNPIGNIANFISGNTPVICDQGTNATISSGWIYTNINSPKDFYIIGGTVSAIIRDGQTIATATLTTTPVFVHLEPKDTFSVAFSSPPTIIPIGQ